KFYADPSQSTVLSIAPVAAFGFLGANPGGTITIQGSTLALSPPISSDGFITTGPAPPLTFVGRDLTVGGTTTPGIALTGTVTANGTAGFVSSGPLYLISVGQSADPIIGGQVKVAPADTPFGFSDSCGCYDPLNFALSGFGIGGSVQISGDLLSD